MKNVRSIPAIRPEAQLRTLAALERKVLWLANWMVHNANHLRPSRDGLKVGGHQASSASMTTIMTALYFDVLRAADRIAVKPHAAPVFHAIQYLLGNQGLDKLKAFRALGGAQSYPSRTKDSDDVDFSTGSVGLGVAATLFGALTRDYLSSHGLIGGDKASGRMVALMGDAELDEGNIFEALLEGWKHDVRNLWWVIDYNRQSLDGVVNDHLFQRINSFFATVDWQVVNIKYGKKMQKAFAGPAGEALRAWIDACPNQIYSALTYKGGAAWRAQLAKDLAGTAGLKELLDSHDDGALAGLMTNLGGHDMEALLEAFDGAKGDRPHCFVAYTIKGYGTPLAGHKDNHAGMMNIEQMAAFQRAMGIAEGQEWEPFAGLEIETPSLRRFLSQVPFAQRAKANAQASTLPVPPIAAPAEAKQSTQAAFGRIMNDLAKRSDDFAARIVTTSPDVTVSTNLGGWVNSRGVFERADFPDLFRQQQVVSAIKWTKGPRGQHLELGIAENNLFTALAALGLSDRLFGQTLLPVGTLYDPFICRGLDAMNYACYQDARFMLVATPSGLSLAPEGGAHQSIGTPLIGMAQDGLAYFEPAYADELAAIMQWGFAHMQRHGDGQGLIGEGGELLGDAKGGSLYLRLSTRPLAQPRRDFDAGLRASVIDGAYWAVPPAAEADLAVVYCGAVAPEAFRAHAALLQHYPGAGLLAVTSPDRLHGAWQQASNRRRRGERAALAPIEALLGPLAGDAALVSVIDGHPATLSWLGSVRGQRLAALGVEHFGQSGDIDDLYRAYGIDAQSIFEAAASLALRRRKARLVSVKARVA